MFEIPASKSAIPPGTYPGILESVEEMPSRNPAYPNNFRLWTFILNVGAELIPLTGTSSLNNGPQTKTYAWLTALVRRAPKAGESIPSPIGQRVMVVVGANDKGWPRITDLLPIAEVEQVVPGVPR